MGKLYTISMAIAFLCLGGTIAMQVIEALELGVF